MGGKGRQGTRLWGVVPKDLEGNGEAGGQVWSGMDRAIAHSSLDLGRGWSGEWGSFPSYLCFSKT